MKEHVMISVDEDIMEKAKMARLNISGVAEDALKKRFVSSVVNIPKDDGVKCDFCGKIEAKATVENLDGLTWLYPDECWICSECLDVEARKIIISFGTPTQLGVEKKKEIMELARSYVNQPPIKKKILEQLKDKITGAGKPPP